MKTDFKEFYPYTNKEIKIIWDKAIFIFDTNILLNLYRFNKKTSEDYIKILKKLKRINRIWTPHQILYEYHKNRQTVIIGLENDYKKALSAIQKGVSKIDDVKGDIRNACDQHPLLDYDAISKIIQDNINNITVEIEKLEKKHPKWKTNDVMLKQIEKIFSNYGSKYDENELKEIYKEGKERFSKKIPPGFEDAKKGEPDGYGDLIIWKQIIDYAKKNKKPIIFVVNDTKSDWWEKGHNSTIGPKFALKKEIFNEAKVKFHMYNSNNFLKYASKYFNEKIEEETTREVIKISRMLEEENYIRNRQMHSSRIRHPFLKELILRQEKLNHRLIYLVEDLKINKNIFEEIKRNQKRIMHFLEMIAHEDRIHPHMIEELFHLQEQMYSKLIHYYKMGSIDKKTLNILSNYFDEMMYSYTRFMKYFDIDPEYFDRFYVRLKKNQRNLKEFMYDLDE